MLAGISRSRLLLEANDQLADRFREILELTPLGVGDKAQESEFAVVMEAFEAMLEGIGHIDLKSAEVLRTLAFATAGRLRNIRKLMVRSVELASREAVPDIGLSVLEKAFLEVIFKNATAQQNPFSEKFRGTPINKAGEPFAPALR